MDLYKSIAAWEPALGVTDSARPKADPGPSSPPRARVRLLPLEAPALEEYLRALVEEYARDHVRDGQWTAAEAPERARTEVAALLPQGVDTPDQYLRAIVADPGGTLVGRLWYAMRRNEGPPHLFIYDLLILEEHRGHGYGEAAMRALEPVARQLGVSRIGLHVFGHNRTAIRLYERVGYRPTNLFMSKAVTDSDHSAAP